ncbi:TIGR01440 family protein [Alicyclobacillaceae bacterium I2511]|nr:TIGR01440 family protein [Alicyclobacillaceae bacterium I2511]
MDNVSLEQQPLDLNEIVKQTGMALHDLLQISNLRARQVVVLGGSTSEVVGEKIGSSTNLEVAEAILDGMLPQIRELGLYIAIQGCEHINRALVVEEKCAKQYELEIVHVFPYIKAGGGLAAVAMNRLENPVVVENVKSQASAGMDIGDVFIGMHMKPVGVVVRSQVKSIGQAHLSMIRARPKLIGGTRAKYSREEVVKWQEKKG